jgi:hypothetical protein
MAWPKDLFSSKKEGEVAEPNQPDPTKPPEKTQAELISESIKAELEPFKAQVMQAISEQVQSLKPKPPDPNANPPENISVLDNEDAAFNQRMSPLLQVELDTRAELMRDRVAREYGESWNHFAADIDATLKQSPIQLRADPAYIRNVADMVIGRKARENGFRFDSENKKFFIEDSGGSASVDAKQPDTSGLTDKQRKVFERMGVPMERAKEVMSKLEFVGN